MSDLPRRHVPDVLPEELERLEEVDFAEVLDDEESAADTPSRDAAAGEEVGDRVDAGMEPGDDLEAEPPEEVDPDLDAARAMSPSERPDALKTDELRPEEELLEPAPPNEPSPETSSGRTAAEERTRETLEERLAQERPEE